jgi:hypothetical protein
MEALTNLDWGCEVLPTKPRGRPKKTSNSPVQERDDWTLQDDVDLPIGLGNDDIFNYEEENFNGSDDCYLSAEEDTGDEYGWEEDTLHEKKHNNWPPEMLHAPSSLRKRRYKRKAPIWPLLDDLTYVSLADGEEGDHSHQEQHRPPLLQGHCSNNDDALILLQQCEYHGGTAAEREDSAGDQEGSRREREGAIGEWASRELGVGNEKAAKGVQVDRGWGALHLDGAAAQRYTEESSSTLGSGYQGLPIVPMPEPAIRTFTSGMPDVETRVQGHVRAP